MSDSDGSPAFGTLGSGGPDDRVRFIEHRGTRILLLDFSGVHDPDEALPVIAHVRKVVAAEPKGSLRTLTYVKGSTFNLDVARALWTLAQHDKPYVIAGAVVGLGGIQSELYQLVNKITKRDIAAFDDLETAAEWLVEKGEG